MTTQETAYADTSHSCPPQWADRAKQIPAWKRLLKLCRYRQVLPSARSEEELIMENLSDLESRVGELKQVRVSGAPTGPNPE